MVFSLVNAIQLVCRGSGSHVDFYRVFILIGMNAQCYFFLKSGFVFRFCGAPQSWGVLRRVFSSIGASGFGFCGLGGLIGLH